jgi:regulatory protein
LKQEGFIDDKRFAYEYAEIKEASLYGRGRISDDLEFVYHVSKEIISSISWSDDEEASKQVARALDRKYSSFPYIKKKAKAKLFLEKRGFLPSSISLALEEIKEDKEKTDKKLYLDATNAYRRLKLRYNGYELRQRLFASLLRKGYDSGSLAKALEEISNEDDI